MTDLAKALFDGHPDLLSATLALSGQVLGRTEIMLDNGTLVERVANGILWIEPARAGDRQLIISAGVHGNETAPIEVCNELVDEMLSGAWTPALRTLLILGNPEAMMAGERFIEHNLNRLFAGAHGQSHYLGSREAQRAADLEAWVQTFVRRDQPLLHYDLHTAIRPSRREKFALYPFVAGREVPQEQIDFLLASDVHTLLLQHKAGTTFSSYTSSTFGAESFTIELGKVRPFGQNDLSRFQGIKESLRSLLSGADGRSGERSGAEMAVFQVVHEILRTEHNFRFHVPDDVANFTEYAPGTVIWEDAETCYRVGEQPEAIVFPNPNVPVGQRVGLMVRERR